MRMRDVFLITFTKSLEYEEFMEFEDAVGRVMHGDIGYDTEDSLVSFPLYFAYSHYGSQIKVVHLLEDSDDLRLDADSVARALQKLEQAAQDSWSSIMKARELVEDNDDSDDE